MNQGLVYFNQDCSVCGRGMRVRIELLGKEIACAHCSAITVASDNVDHPWAGSDRFQKIDRKELRELAFSEHSHDIRHVSCSSIET
ncbi:hypothetical protein [Rubripirellula reticaptiva]|uniref:Uncharacterized protein n=1 Tax=Rubripirellula reticaptiva TaxID=2528013 RepID=A0A5C6EGH1_9BACT|nr:hypothetical protein [Rubripirellula reticaptiva]TWU46676.1 hypothetical protein Poly59_56490 [Rubripirellula reticaptiva]